MNFFEQDGEKIWTICTDQSVNVYRADLCGWISAVYGNSAGA